MSSGFFKEILSGLNFGGKYRVGTGAPPTDDLTKPTRDALFNHQLATPDPYALTPESLLIAKITETSFYSSSVFHSCQKAGVISAGGRPDTSRIDRSLVNKIAKISVPKMRELVNMLFFWEEESVRLRMLDEEIERLEGEAGQSEEEREQSLKVLRAQRKVVPSLRGPDGAIMSDSEELPAYDTSGRV